jgi:hypothetical protein
MIGKCYRKLNWAVRFGVLMTITMISPTVFLDVADTHQAARYQIQEDCNVLLSSPWGTQCWAAIYHNTRHHISLTSHVTYLRKLYEVTFKAISYEYFFIRRGNFVAGLCQLLCHSDFWASRDQIRSPSRDTPWELGEAFTLARLNQYAPASEQL